MHREGFERGRPPGSHRQQEAHVSARPDPSVRTERSQKRVRAYLSGELVADTSAPLLVWENRNFPAYYIPAGDVKAGLVLSGQSERHPRLGDAELLHVKTATATAELAARRYPDAPVPDVRNAIRLDWAAMSEWLEEDEPVYVHPRSPYTRVDILASSRLVRIELDGVAVAESGQPRILFETGLPPRYYLPLTDLRMDLLNPSNRTTQCPYKGTASYWSVDTTSFGGRMHQDVVWMYRAPLPESQKIAGLACFYNERVDLYVDGVTVADSHQPRILFETGLPPRYYLPLSDLRLDLLRPSATRSHCPYMGTASYWSADTGQAVHADIAWIYRTPLPESQKIAGLACFYNEKTDLYLDGVPQERAQTKFS